MRLNGGPLAYESVQEPEPLSLAEEAALAFAACGVTGYTMAELPYDTGNVPEAGSGNIIVNFIGQTTFSADAAHLVSIFVLNDDGVWLLKRPQDYPRLEIPALVQAAREHRWQELYEQSRVRIADRRLDVPRELPIVSPFNGQVLLKPSQVDNRKTWHCLEERTTNYSSQHLQTVRMCSLRSCLSQPASRQLLSAR